ncbi:MAG: metal-dependent hydrolase [Anaerolineaceae bacterium]|nr:metal-dependent hydrolase [Anaerolineaceae bacterium]
MTSTGHFLTGISIGVLCLPKNSSKIHQVAHLSVFTILSIVPDLPFPGWGHGNKYYFSHSLFVNLALIASIIIAFLISSDIRRQVGGWPVMIGGALAWLSHLLLDSFYNTGYGVAIFWPVSDARLILPIPWLSLSQGQLYPFTLVNLKIVAIETVTFLPLLLLAIFIRRTKVFRRLAAAIRL